jgi:hypothetical protein
MGGHQKAGADEGAILDLKKSGFCEGNYSILFAIIFDYYFLNLNLLANFRTKI